MHRIIFIFVLGLFFSCADNKTTDAVTLDSDSAERSSTLHTNAADTIVTSEPMVLNGCYQMTLKQDTASLELTVKDTTVTGNLRYDWHQKDGNTGTIKGVLRNNLILADYTFQSEGVTSVREVVFKIEAGTLLQGFGDLTEQKGKVIFKNKDHLQFHTDNPFIKVDCNELKKPSF